MKSLTPLAPISSFFTFEGRTEEPPLFFVLYLPRIDPCLPIANESFLRIRFVMGIFRLLPTESILCEDMIELDVFFLGFKFDF